MLLNPATPQAFLSGMEETAEVLCVLLLFFLTSCAQYFSLSLLLRHSKQHHKANDKKNKGLSCSPATTSAPWYTYG